MSIMFGCVLRFMFFNMSIPTNVNRMTKIGLFLNKMIDKVKNREIIMLESAIRFIAKEQ